MTDLNVFVGFVFSRAYLTETLKDSRPVQCILFDRKYEDIGESFPDITVEGYELIAVNMSHHYEDGKTVTAFGTLGKAEQELLALRDALQHLGLDMSNADLDVFIWSEEDE